MYNSGKLTNQEAKMALDSAIKREIISQFGKDEKDTGSPAVQIALLTARINQINEHLKKHKHDYSSRLGLLKLVGQRKRLMRYLKRTNHDKYLEVIAKLGLRDRIKK